MSSGGSGEPGGSGGSDALDRARRARRRAAEDARRAERDVARTQASMAALEAELERTRRRLTALRDRPSVRVAVRVADAVAGLRSRLDPRAHRGAAAGGAAALRRRPGSASVHLDEASVEPRLLARRYRTMLLAALHRAPGQPGHALRVAVIGPGGELPTALRERGYEVAQSTVAGAPSIDPATDVVVGTDAALDVERLPIGVITVALRGAGGADAPIAAEADVKVDAAGDDRAGAVVSALDGWLRATRVGIRLPAAARTAAAWGDTYLARDLRTALRATGWPTRIHHHAAWDDPAVGRDDVVLDLLGVFEATSRPGAVRVLWQISHPELATADLYESYDLVFVASDPFAREMAERVRIPVMPLHQATDPARFRAEPAGPGQELLFVANWRAPGRPILDDLLPTDRDLAVYGRGWTPDRLDPRHLAGEAIPNDELGGHYAAASIVLNDHWAAMAREGFLSNRLYDAAASGALVISDEVEGLDAEFDGGVVGYRDRDELHRLVDRYLGDPELRRRTAERARAAVLARHTFAHRARAIIDALEPLVRRATTIDEVEAR